MTEHTSKDVLEIYFDDLTLVAQSEVLKFWNTTEEDGNFDLSPLFILEEGGDIK